MKIKSKMLFVIIGNNGSGKTTLQKLLVEKLCNVSYDRLPSNTSLPIKHPEIERKYATVSFANRSYQEKKGTYKNIDEYFKEHFENCDISFISSHLVIEDIRQMISNGKKFFFNVSGLFLTNSISNNPVENSEISELDWDERFIIENPLTQGKEAIDHQLNSAADSLVNLLVKRTKVS